MVSGKSRNGRGGSSGRSRPEQSRKEISSTSSRRLDTSSSSPASVSRRTPPEGSSEPPAMSPPPSRFSPQSNTSRYNNPSRNHSSSHQSRQQIGHLQHQPQGSGDISPPVIPLQQLEDPIESKDEMEHGSDGDSSSEDEELPPITMTVDQLLNTPDRHLYVDTLSPHVGQGYWFTRNKSLLTNKIAKLLQDNFKGQWYSWSVTPTAAQEMYFIEFAKRYTWDPRLTPQVRDHFNAICLTRLKGLVNYARTTRKRPNWIRGKIWKKMVKFWNTEDAMRRSQKASLARMSDRGGLGPHKHVGGPKSNAQHQIEMSEKEGREVSFAEVFVKTHTRKDGTYVDEKARQIAQTYEQNLQAMQSELSVDMSLNSDGASPSLTTQQLDDIFLKSTTKDSRGNPFGLGSLSQVRKTQTSTSVHPSSSAITALEVKLKETELKLAEQVQQNKAQMDFMMKYLKEKDPSLPDFVVSTTDEDPMPQDHNTAN